MAAYHFVAVTESRLAEELRRVSGGHRDEAGANLQPALFSVICMNDIYMMGFIMPFLYMYIMYFDCIYP